MTSVPLVWINDDIGYRCPECALFVCIPRRDPAYCPRCEPPAAGPEGEAMNARCPVCGLDRSARNQRDGSGVVIRFHHATVYDHMQGERVRVECEGSFAIVDAPDSSPAQPADPPTTEQRR